MQQATWVPKRRHNTSELGQNSDVLIAQLGQADHGTHFTHYLNNSMLVVTSHSNNSRLPLQRCLQ